MRMKSISYSTYFTYIGLLDVLEGESNALPPEGLEPVFVLTWGELVEASLLNYNSITKLKIFLKE